MGENQGVARSSAILHAVGSEEAFQAGGLLVTQVAERVQREKTQVSRTLKALMEAGLVDRDPETHRYRVGWQLYALAARGGDSHLLYVSQPILRRLVALTGETAHISVRVGFTALTVASERSPRALQVSSWVGRASPLHLTSAGRALIFDMHDEDLEAFFTSVAFPEFGPNSPASTGEVLERLARDRRRGYSLAIEELEDDLIAVGAPIRDSATRIVAAVNVSGPKSRLNNMIERTGQYVRAAAALISTDFGLPKPRTPRKDSSVEELGYA